MNHAHFANDVSAITRRSFLADTARAAALATCSAPLSYLLTGCAATASAPGRRMKTANIIFIMADDLGYAELGCYGQQKIRTPNIDKLADEGVRFSQCYSGCTVCAPSRSVLMTGYHMGHTSVRENSGGVPLLDEDFTVAELLSKAGYTTGCFGKWGLGDIGTEGVPTKQGFDEFFGYLHQVHAHWYYPEFLWDGVEKFVLDGNEDDGRKTYSHDVIMDRALSFIRRNSHKPFFCYMPVTIPHTELLVPQESLAEYAGQFEEPTPFVSENGHVADQPHPRAAFAAMVTHLDKGIGKLTALLRELDIDRNTIVFFTSDNGGQKSGGVDADFFYANGPLRGYKRDMYEGGLRVPMIVRWPGYIEPETVSDHIWYFADIMPTLAELAGAERFLPRDSDGLSVVPILLGRDIAGRRQSEHEFLYWEFGRGRSLQQAVRAGKFKAVRHHPEGPIELYDLVADIGEATDTADKHPETVAQMHNYMRREHTPMRPQGEPPGTPWHWSMRRYE